MTRRFQRHNLRRVYDLSGTWDFVFLGDVDPDSVDVECIECPDRMAVPGAFDATPIYAGKRGLAAYQITVPANDTSPNRLVFNSVNHWCRVFVNHRAVRDHAGGYTSFAVDWEQALGDAIVTALVDNRIDYSRCPLHLDYFDWYHYGGITRPVELHHLNNLWIDRVQVVTSDWRTREVKLSIDYASTEAAKVVQLVVECDKQRFLSESVELADKRGRIERVIKLDGFSLWSPDEPNLHLLDVRLGDTQLGDDDWRERIGIRQVETRGQQILINDRPVQLRGVNRHESHPQFGPALPEQILIADVQQLLDLGCNFVRSSHYPADPRFLDLCDEAGLCVWNEATGWQQTVDHLTDPHYLQAARQNIDEMVAMSSNHPAVIMWGILNESRSDESASRPTYEELIGRIRELDSSRPVTYASNHPFNDLCLDLVDVVSINTYPGWYIGELDGIPGHLDRIVEHLDSTGSADKPLIISEIGAGAVPGWRDWNQSRWSEEYQALLLETVIRHMFDDSSRFCGLAIWQFCDVRSSEQVARTLGRPRGFNNKGVVDEYRRPKLAYALVKERYTALAESLAM